MGPHCLAVVVWRFKGYIGLGIFYPNSVKSIGTS